MYTAIGLAFGLIVWYATPNPRKWFGGVVAAGGFNNSSDLPIAYITTLASSSLFPAGSAQQGTAYAVIFVVVFIICMFNLGGVSLIGSDFKYRVHDPEADEVTTPIISVDGVRRGARAIRSWRNRNHTIGNGDVSLQDINSTATEPTIRMGEGIEDDDYENAVASDDESGLPQRYTADHDEYEKRTHRPSRKSESSFSRVMSDPRYGESIYLRTRSDSISVAPGAATTVGYRRPARLSRLSGTAGDIRPTNSLPDASESENLQDVILSYSAVRELQTLGGTEESCSANPVSNTSTGTTTDASPLPSKNRTENESKDCESVSPNETDVQPPKPKFYSYLKVFLANFLRPISMSLFLSLAVSMAPPLRRLFYIDADNKNPDQFNIPYAPDNQPVLDFVMDFTSFVGNACVPLGLSMLGATIARLEVKQFPKGFWKSMALMSVLKLVVLPIISVLWVKKLLALNWIDEDNTMAIFVMIVTAGVPTATSQLYITAMFTPPGESHIQIDCLAAYLICQYSFLVFTLSILVTYTLKNVVSV
ncbi:putative ATPase ECM3 [Sugiyamaella lignohabitans]|uniref:Putative ATPase ECM3 n=1 Tax=Sugiyamaella lignohabitans TaxID=796027 RepID=A0A161HJT8_9ASCO|nr:putative ATPase ECM3 [Sugiyamaella lignohabitans]ANB11748.1 putative ATPase ECM3 [Sugiyamaella lignohabitans]